MYNIFQKYELEKKQVYEANLGRAIELLKLQSLEGTKIKDPVESAKEIANHLTEKVFDYKISNDHRREMLNILDSLEKIVRSAINGWQEKDVKMGFARIRECILNG